MTTKKTLTYEKFNEYFKDDNFVKNPLNEPTIEAFKTLICEETTLVAECVLNTKENFPLKKKKNGENAKKQRKYFDPEHENFEGKKVDYKEVDKMWVDNENEWLYCLVYDGHIVKIGMTIKSLKERFGSYSCGTDRAMTKGSCSTTNFIITECNFRAIMKGMKVEIYGIACPTVEKVITRFGVTKI